MINEEKLRLMVKSAVLEKNSREAFNINDFYKRDYICLHVILIWICISVAYVLLAGCAVIVYIEQYPEKAQELSLSAVIFTLLMAYLIISLIYIIVAMFIYAARYNRAQTVIRRYNSVLKLLEREYEKENSIDRVGDKKNVKESGPKKRKMSSGGMEK